MSKFRLVVLFLIPTLMITSAMASGVQACGQTISPSVFESEALQAPVLRMHNPFSRDTVWEDREIFLPQGFVSQDPWGEIYRKIPMKGFWNGVRRWRIAVLVVPWVETRTYLYQPVLQLLEEMSSKMPRTEIFDPWPVVRELGSTGVISLAAEFAMAHFDGPGLFFGNSNVATEISWEDAPDEWRIYMLKYAAYFATPFSRAFKQAPSTSSARWLFRWAFLKSFGAHAMHNAWVFWDRSRPMQFVFHGRRVARSWGEQSVRRLKHLESA